MCRSMKACLHIYASNYVSVNKSNLYGSDRNTIYSLLCYSMLTLVLTWSDTCLGQ